MKKILFLLIALFLPFIVFPFSGYSQEIQWSAHAGGGAFDGGGNIYSDINGNTYVSGWTNSYYCFFDLDTIEKGLFLVKYNSSGNLIKLLPFYNGTGSFTGEGGNIVFTLDTLRSELLVTGSSYGAMTLPDGSGLAGWKNTIFLLKMDLEGNIKWKKTAGGKGDDQAFAITYDPDGNIYISGSNSDSAKFDNITIPSGGFIAAYDSNGSVIWAKHKFRYFKSPNDNGFPFDEATPYRILYNRNALLIYGEIIRDTVVIDTVTFKNPPGFHSAFISSYSLSGDLEWIKCAGGPRGWPTSFATDKLGNIFISGQFEHKGIFGNDTLIQTGQLEDAFLAKYDVNGNYYWATNLKCSRFADGWAVAADSGGCVYFAGNFSGTAFFGNNLISSKYYGTTQFLAKYSADGNNIGVAQYGKGGIYGLALDDVHNVCFTGDFLDTLTLGRHTYYSRGDYDFFAAKSSPIINGIETKSQKEDKLLIYANPTTGICNIDIPESFQNEQELNLFIYDTAGKLIQKVPVILGEDKITFDIQAQAKGVYPVILTNGTKNYTGKIIFE